VKKYDSDIEMQFKNGWTSDAYIEEASVMLRRAVEDAGRGKFKDAEHYFELAYAAIAQIEDAIDDIRREALPTL